MLAHSPLARYSLRAAADSTPGRRARRRRGSLLPVAQGIPVSLPMRRKGREANRTVCHLNVRLPRAWAPRATFGSGSICCGLAIENPFQRIKRFDVGFDLFPLGSGEQWVRVTQIAKEFEQSIDCNWQSAVDQFAPILLSATNLNQRKMPDSLVDLVFISVTQKCSQ